MPKIQVTVSRDELTEIATAAEEQGHTRSSWARRQLKIGIADHRASSVLKHIHHLTHPVIGGKKIQKPKAKKNYVHRTFLQRITD